MRTAPTCYTSRKICLSLIGESYVDLHSQSVLKTISVLSVHEFTRFSNYYKCTFAFCPLYIEVPGHNEYNDAS